MGGSTGLVMVLLAKVACRLTDGSGSLETIFREGENWFIVAGCPPISLLVGISTTVDASRVMINGFINIMGRVLSQHKTEANPPMLLYWLLVVSSSSAYIGVGSVGAILSIR